MSNPDIRRYLSIRSATSPSFSADGRRIAFLADMTGHAQVWTVPVEGGWPDQVTFGERRVITVEYSPLFTELLVGSDLGGNEHQQLYVVHENGEGEQTITDSPEAIHTSACWSPDGTKVAFAANRRRRDSFDVYVRELSGDEIMVFETDGHVVPVAWSPKGDTLLLSRSFGGLRNQIMRFDLASRALDKLTSEDADARFLSIRWARNGRIWCVTDQGSDFLYPAEIDPAGGILPVFDGIDWDVESIEPLGQTGRLAWTTNRDGTSDLTIFEPESGTVLTPPDLPDGVIDGLTSSADGRLIAFTLSGARHNPDIWTVEIESGRTRRVTKSFRAGLAPEQFIEPELVHFPTFDNRHIPGWFFRPIGRTGPFPCIVDVHGGPESQRRATFAPLTQYYLDHGYAVFAPNVRGSTGYGREFSHLDDGRKRMDSVRDLEYAYRWLTASGGVDPKRVAITGGSYGGFMVLAALTTFPDRWAAAIDIVGIANFLTFLEHTGPWRRKLRIAEYGDPAVDGDFLREISPIHQVERIQTPLLVIHGANDPRVPVGEAEQIVASLRERGHPVEYVRFEDEGHGIAKLANKITAYSAVVDFLNLRLGHPV